MRKYGRFFRDIAAPALFACWIAYLSYGAIAGAAGYRVLTSLEKDVAEKRSELAVLTERRKILAQRADLLNPRSLDPDMLDERVRAVLGYAQPGDVVIPRDEIDRIIKATKSP